MVDRMAVKYAEVRALVADREEHMRKLIRDMLRALGFGREHIRVCRDGEEALSLLAAEKAQLLITGLRMTPIDGLTLTRELRDPAVSPAPGIPIILCSAVLDRKLLDEVWRAGANAIVSKPVSAAALERHVSAVLERPQPVVVLKDYVGPDRRHEVRPVAGNERRSRPDFWEL
jgi:CheY-like chemotaxis protein